MKTISLDGSWDLTQTTGQRKFVKCKAMVPGTVQQSLEHIIGNPVYGNNVLAGRWVEEQLWYYQREFTLSSEDMKKQLRVVFLGLDLTAEIYINDKHAGSHNNFYVPCALDITSFVHEGINTVRVEIESGINYASKKDTVGLYPEPWEFGYHLHNRAWLRKPQCSFEWDWSPRCINVGIYKSCYIEISDGIFPKETSIYTNITDDYTEGTVSVRQYLQNYSGQRLYKINIRVKEVDTVVELEGIASPGESYITAVINIEKPLLWNPVNYGSQNRYTIEIMLTDTLTGNMITCITKKTAFRKVVINQESHPKSGGYFIVNINGNNIFTKGGNMVPADLIFSRLTRDIYDTLTDRALEANCNALRVWGGGIYETDDFYDLCDAKGILVWQDFINACGAYPAAETEFYENYKREIIHNVRRLSPYASLIIWSGNNEIDWQARSLLGNDKVKKYPDAQLYYIVIPMILRSECDNRYYQPSSPFSPDGSDPNSNIIGDQHPWDIGFTDKDYYKYRSYECRFANEGGVLGSTSYPNTMACLEEDEAFIGSFSWELHNNTIAINNPQTKLVKEKFGVDLTNALIKDYIYYAGLGQGEGLTEYILNFRRRMYDSASAIFWMYNDTWPATNSWTIVDYLRRRTPSFYPVKRAFESTAVDIVRTDDGFDVYAINEKLHAVHAELEYGSMGVDKYIFNEKIDVILDANTSSVVAHIETDKYSDSIPYAVLKSDEGKVTRRRLIEKAMTPASFDLSEIKVELEDDIAIYRSERLVLGVCIDLDGKCLSDNFFDLYPGQPHTVKLNNGSGEVLYCYAPDI